MEGHISMVVSLTELGVRGAVQMLPQDPHGMSIELLTNEVVLRGQRAAHLDARTPEPRAQTIDACAHRVGTNLC